MKAVGTDLVIQWWSYNNAGNKGSICICMATRERPLNKHFVSKQQNNNKCYTLNSSG